MSSADQIDIIQLPRQAPGDAAGAMRGWPEGWPEDIILALRRDESGMSLMPCHSAESAEMLIQRLAHVEGKAETLYRVYPTVMAEPHADTIAKLLREDEDLFERAEEFALNYEFMLPPPAAAPEPAPSAPEPAVKAPPQAAPQMLSAAVDLSDLSLIIATDGSAVLELPGGEGGWTPPDTFLSQSLDGATLTLNLAAMHEAGSNAAQIQFPPRSFTFRDCSYAISRRDDMLYFWPKFTNPTPTERKSPLNNRPLLAALAGILLLLGVIIGLALPRGTPALAQSSTVEQLRQSMFTAP